MSQLSLSDSDRSSHEVDARGRLELDDAFEVLVTVAGGTSFITSFSVLRRSI